MRTRALIILGLSGLAVAQPLLDLFGQNPEFFVAGNYSRAQIVWFALLITLVPPLVGIGATMLAMLVSDTFGTIVFVTVVAALATVFGLALLRTLGLDQIILVAVLALLVGAGVAVLVLRTRGIRLFVSYLAAANLLFLGSFFFLSPTSELVAGGSSGDVGDISVPTLHAPVVVIVLDELAAATLMPRRRFAQRRAIPRLRRAGVGEHLVPQRVEPVQPHPPRRAIDPRRHVG